MIESGVITVLAANEAIADRVTGGPGKGLRIYRGAMPQGLAIDGGTIVVSKVGRTREYGLVAEEESKYTTVQVDCYDLTDVNADSLAELVTAAISGEAAIGLAAGDHRIESSLIIGERTEYQKPVGADDNWRPRDSRDYRIHHT